MIKYNIDRDSITPVYIQLKEQLKAAINDGRLAPLSPMPLVTDIAKNAGVSIRTADKALLELIKDGLCIRKPKKGTFVQIKNAFVKKHVYGVIGLTDSISHPLVNLLYCGLMEIAARKGVLILPFLCSQDNTFQENPELLIRRCDRGNEFDLKGVFFLNPQFDLAFELAEKFPEKKFFILNHRFDGYREMLPNMASVVNDDFFGAYQLAQSVFFEYKPLKPIILTHRLSNHNLTYSERCRGFRLAAKENSKKIHQTVVPQYPSGKAQINSSYNVAKILLKSEPDIDCIFCTNDFTAIGALKAAKELGLSEKICITGYDCVQDIIQNEFSSVKVPYTEMGRISMEKILEEEPPAGALIKLTPEIIKAEQKQ